MGPFKILFNLFTKYFQTDILKVFTYTSLSTIVKMFTGFISVKVVAIIIGPSGIALLGQLYSFSAIALTLASGGINLGITKYISEYKDDDSELRNLMSSAFKITLFSSLVCGLLMLIFNSYLSKKIFLTSEYNFVFIVFGFSVILYAFNMMLLSILNGYKDFKNFVKINIANSIIGLGLTLISVFIFGLKGALVAAISYQSVMFFVTIWMLRDYQWLDRMYFFGVVKSKILKQYFHYSLMAIASAATVPIAQILIRGYVIKNLSIEDAGYWEAMNQLSNMYLMVIISSLSIYFLPTLARLKNKLELKKEILKVYKVIMPLLFIGLGLVFLFRNIIINLVFSKEFMPMSDLFIWQLVADFFKIAGWILAFNMLAKSMTIAFISTEIIFSSIFIINSYLLVNLGGSVIGVTQAYLINKVLYFILMLIIFRKTLWQKKNIL